MVNRPSAATTATSGDGTIRTGLWECGPGRFRTTYDDEGNATTIRAFPDDPLMALHNSYPMAVFTSPRWLSPLREPVDDRILRRFAALIRATLRTNFYQRDAAGAEQPAPEGEQQEQPPKPEGPGPAESSGRLWVPGR